jgi:DNA repair protein RecN (Recombination protein N)
LRSQAATRLCDEVTATLDRLALPGARFEIELAPRELFEGGLENVTFSVSINKGESLKPIAKAASGGELSRIALALHLAEDSAASTTMVFDEVDAGVGGTAAQSVGRALSDLARGSGIQVLVVTHLPQVAAFADNHLRVAKLSDEARTRATVARVEDEERVEELSRMLAGLPESEVGQEHARELLALAAGGAPAA